MFTKGHKINVGRPKVISLEQRELLRQLRLGKKLSEETKQRISLSGKGRKLSEETKRKMSISKIGTKAPWSTGKQNIGKKHSEEHNKKIGLSGLGRKHSQETKNKIRLSQMGEKHPNWKGGVTDVNERIRHSIEYKLWRKSVFERDNYTCIWCKIKGVELQADHIKPFAYYPELRFAIDNGRTLCICCHRKTDTWGNRIISNKNIRCN